MPAIATSTSAFFERSNAELKTLRSQTEAIQSQIGTGQRLTRSSDDPLAASRLRGLLRADRLATVDTDNANRAASDLSLADSALSDIADAVTRVRELAVQASSDALGPEQRRAIATELDAIHASILATANARDSSGHALFGGETTGDAYELDGSGNAVYIGTGSAPTFPIGENESVVTGLTGPQVLAFEINGASTDLLSVVKSLSLAMADGSTASAALGRDALPTLDAGLDKVTTAQTVIGTRLAWLDVSGERRLDLSEARTQLTSDLGATDIASSVTRLQEMMVVLEASQASFVKLASLSLFDQLR